MKLINQSTNHWFTQSGIACLLAFVGGTLHAQEIHRTANTAAGGSVLSGTNTGASATGVKGTADFVGGEGGTGVYGSGTRYGVNGVSANGDGVSGTTHAARKSGVFGYTDIATSWGVLGFNADNTIGGVGVLGSSNLGDGVFGVSTSKNGVHGWSSGATDTYTSSAIWGENSSKGAGVTGTSTSGNGVAGWAHVAGKSGVFGCSDKLGGWGVFGFNSAGGEAGHFQGNVAIFGKLSVNGTVVYGSDRNTKEDFAPVNAQAVLVQLQALPLSTWKYKGADSRRHIGPMAQDFHAAFDGLLDLKSDDKTISPLDEAGVAFAAIQALQTQVTARDEKVAALEKRLAALEAPEARLTRLENGPQTRPARAINAALDLK